MNLKEVGRKIASQRKIKGYTQEKLAEMVDLTVGYISGIESGNKVASLKNMLKIANALEMSMDFMLLIDITTEDVKNDKYIMEFKAMIEQIGKKEKIEKFIIYARAIAQEMSREN